MNLFAKDRSVKAPRIPSEVGALLSALQVREADRSLLKNLSDEAWTRLLEFSNIANLTLPLAQLDMEGFPGWVIERLKTNLADNAQRVERIKMLYREAASALDSVGVAHIVIKGFTQAPDYVATPRLRAQSDLDFFCPPESITDAREALHKIGYLSETKVNTSCADHGAALVRLGNWQWRGNPFDAEMPLGIELHFCLWNEVVSRIAIPGIELFWERRIRREIDGLSVPCLSEVDQLGYLALHILRNLFFRDWIVHHLRELAVFLHSHGNDDDYWRRWSESHPPKLKSCEAIAFYHARMWFGCSLHPLAGQEIAGLPATQQSWLKRFSNSALEAMFESNKDALWLQLSFLSSRGDKWKVLRRTLIPARVATMDSPIVRIRNKRLVARSAGSARWRQYLDYLLARSASHTHASLTAITRGARWRLSQHRLPPQFWIFLGASFFFDLGLSIYYFLFNLFLLGHGYTEKTLGLLTGAMAIGNLVGALPAGRLAQRVGLRLVLVACFVLATGICSARTLLLGLSWQLPLAFLAGVTLSAWAVCLSPTVAQLADEEQRPFAFSLIFSIGIGLGAVGGLAGSRLPGWFADHSILTHALQPDQVVLLFSCCIVALGVWPIAKLSLTRFDRPREAQPLISPFMLRYLPAIAVWSLVTGSFSPLATVYFARHLHMSLPQIGNAFSLSQIAQVVAVLLSPVLFRRLGLIRGVVSTQLAAAALLLSLAILDHPAAATAAYVGFTALQWMNEPGLYSLLMNMVPVDEAGRASASNSFAMSASQALAAPAAGGAFSHWGYPLVLRGISLIAVVAAALFWRIQEQPEQNSSLVFEDARD